MRRLNVVRRLAPVAAIAAVLVATACGGGGATGSGSSPASGANLGSADAPTLDQLYAGLSTAPPATAPAPAAGKSIWIITCSSAVSSCQDTAVSGQEAAQRMGMNATIIDGKYNDGGAWSSAITSAIAARADGIILVGMDCQNVQQPVRQARAANIHVMGVLTSDCQPAQFDVEMKFSDAIPSNDAWDYNIGANSANYIIGKTQGQANLLISEPTSEKAPQLVHQGFLDTINANCPNCKILNQIPYQTVDFVPNGAWIQAFRSQLTKFGSQANAIFTEWDVMAAELGGAQAVTEAGLKDSTTVFGGLGLPATLEQVRAGNLDAVTAAMSMGWVGYGMVDQMNRAFNGQPAVSQGLGFAIVDKDHNLPAPGQPYEPNVDWKAAYLKAWGLT
jgi:ribose transport system substrate-binding protein